MASQDKFSIEIWINNLLSTKEINPDDEESFKTLLLEGILEDDINKIEKAYEEINGDEMSELTIKLDHLKTSFKTDDIDTIVHNFLVEQKLDKNEELKKIMITSLETSNLKPAFELISKKVIKKKVPIFEEFLKKNEPKTAKKETFRDQRQKTKEIEEELIKDSTSKEIEEELKETVPSHIKKKEEIPLLFKAASKSSSASKTQSFWLIYESYEDSSSEYKMEKIKFNAEECEKLGQSTKGKNVEIIGYYGDFEKSLETIENHLQLDLNELRSQEKPKMEGIFAIAKGDQIALMFVTESSLYDFKSKADSNQLAVTYLRFLIDLCKTIIICPSSKWSLNSDTQTPYNDKLNPRFEMKELIIEPSDKILLQEIPLIEGKKQHIAEMNLKNFNITTDFSKYVVKADLKAEENIEVLKKEINYCDIHPKQNNFFFYSSSEYNMKKMSFDEIKKGILDFWVVSNTFFYEQYYPRKFENTIKSLLKDFVEESKKHYFEKLVDDLQNEFIERNNQIELFIDEKYNQEMNLHYQNLYEYFKTQDCKNLKMEESKLKVEESKGELNDGMWAKMKAYFGFSKELSGGCNSKCLSINIGSLGYNNSRKYKNINYDKITSVIGYGYIYLHHSQKRLPKVLEKINNELGKLKEEYEKSKQLETKNLRASILKQLFESLNDIIVVNRKNYLYSLVFQFQSFNVIRNTANKIENFNVNQAPFVINFKFGKDGNEKSFVRDLFFLEENSGIILFSNYPHNKSSIYYFNIANKHQPLVNPIMNLSSPECYLIIEPVLKVWCSYDNKEQRFNMGRISQCNLDDGLPLKVYDEWREGLMIRSIISACFLPFSDSIFIINQDHDFFELKYQSRSLNALFKKENKGGEGVVKSKIAPKVDSAQYNNIQSSIDGKNLIIASKNVIDIYDLNWNMVHSINVGSDFLHFKMFSDKINNFIIIIETNSVKCYQLIGLTATKTIETKITGKETISHTGNPLIDYIYLAFRKFGPHSFFIGSPPNTKLIMSLENEENKQEKIEKYFQSLNISKVNLEFACSKEEIVSSLKAMKNNMQKSIVKAILFSRVPLHVATIENLTLVPLQNGKNISDQIAESIISKEKNHDLIKILTDIIKLGAYEQYLMGLTTNLTVVSIVGRQSSGKSYVMNRFFGTRFNVASTRCTDGIWISICVMPISEEESKVFIAMDCEGLFSARRNDQEEMKLCLALAAVSDVMILNQDLNFNRYLNQLFTNFSKAVGRVKGKKLFKGYLLMLIRDVKSEEADDAYKELGTNMAQITVKENNFLTALFQGKLKSQCLNYFQQPIFHKEIEMIRNEYYLSLNEKRWLNGRDLLESFKITLAQIFVDDDTDMDIHKINITCEHLFKESLKLFYEGGDKFEKCLFEKEFTFVEESFNVKLNHAEIRFEIDEDKSIEKENPAFELIDKFNEQTTPYTRKTHNAWTQNLSLFLNSFMEQRLNLTLKHFEDQFQPDSDFKSIIKNNSVKLNGVLYHFINLIKFCDKTCRKCNRTCTQQFNHNGDCNCKTGHKCEETCDRTPICKSSEYVCIEPYGHEGSHRCNEGSHMCDFTCEMIKYGCTNLCSYEVGHKDPISHNCKNSHACSEKCTDEKCSRSCKYDRTVEHLIHECGETKCVHKCELCEKMCIFPDHMHDKLINGEEKAKLLFVEGKEYFLTYHICGDDHYCGERKKTKCEKKGVCQVDFNVIEKIWKNEFGEFNYNYYEPKDSRLQCSVVIPKYILKHEDIHKCSLEEPHRCFVQCPECKSFCKHPIDHDGFHSTSTHRNKENSIFISREGKSKVEITTTDKKVRTFNVGEVCQPENCSSSCQRKGRAHFHLRECLGEEKCEAKINPFVKHSKEKFHPFESKVFDMWLCTNYWNSVNWDIPVDLDQKLVIPLCNFICGHYAHKDDHSFCTKKAWHEDAHQFLCKHKETYSSDIIDIVFCCDTTGSMGSYIEKSKDSVRKVITSVKGTKSGAERSVRFAFVAYRDHPPQDTSYVTKVHPLGEEASIISFISTVTAAGGGDGPESVLDGLYDSINKIAWRKDSLRYIIHIADAPPHGKEYTGGSGDGFPDGCPCKIKIEDLAMQIKEKNIRYKLLKIGSYPNTMASVFRSKISGYEESDLDSAVQLEVKVSDIVVRDIKAEDLDFFKD